MKIDLLWGALSFEFGNPKDVKAIASDIHFGALFGNARPGRVLRAFVDEEHFLLAERQKDGQWTISSVEGKGLAFRGRQLVHRKVIEKDVDIQKALELIQERNSKSDYPRVTNMKGKSFIHLLSGSQDWNISVKGAERTLGLPNRIFSLRDAIRATGILPRPVEAASAAPPSLCVA